MHVDRDDGGGSGDPGALHGVESDAATADDGDGVSDAHVAGVDGGAESGEDTAAEQGGGRDRDVVGDLDRGSGGHDGPLREAAQSAELADGGAVQAHPGASVGHGVRTEHGPWAAAQVLFGSLASLVNAYDRVLEPHRPRDRLGGLIHEYQQVA